MNLTFAYDKLEKQAHYRVRHSNINEGEFSEIFSNPIVVIGQRGSVLKAVGRNFNGRFITVVFIRKSSDHYHVITAWPSKRKQILLWHREMKNK